MKNPNRKKPSQRNYKATIIKYGTMEKRKWETKREIMRLQMPKRIS